MKNVAKIFLLVLFCISSLLLKAQSPSGLPSPNNPFGYYNIGWYRSDSGIIFANRQPNFTPLYPFTVVGYLNPGIDTGMWWSTGVTWYEIPKIGGGGGGGGGITQLTGDGTTPTGGGVQPFTLATVNTNVGSFGDASHVSDFTVNGKGLITSAGSIPIQITESQVTNLVSDLAGKQGTITLGSTLQYLRGDLSLATFPTNLSSFTNGPGYITTISGIAAGGALSGTYPNPGLAPVVTAGTCTNCALTYNSAGQITVASSGSGGGALTGGGGLSPLFTNGVSGSTLTFTAQTVTSYAAYGNFTGGTAIPGFSKIPIQAMTFGTANQVLGGDGSGNPSFIAAGTNIAIGSGTIATTANVSFTNLTATGTVSFSGLLSGGITDSIVLWNSSTHNLEVTSRTFVIYAIEGTSPDGNSGDSIKLGGYLGAFYKPDTIYTNGQSFYITGLPSKATALSTDSVMIEDVNKKIWLLPVPSGGGSQTLQQVFTVQGNRAILTVADTLDATASDLRLIGNIVPSTNASSNLGNGTNNFLAVNAHQFVSNNNMVFGIPTGDSYTWNINSVANMALLSTGQLRLNQYTTTGSFTGTAVGVLEFDASGNILTAAIGTSTITLTGTSGGGQVASAFTFATTTNTANTALTIPGSSNIFTFTYNPAWDMWDNSRTANNNIFGGASVGNTSLSGVRNLGIGGSGSTAITSGSNNIGIGFNSNFSVTTASDDVTMGYAANSSDVSGGQNVAAGTFALKNNTTAGETAFGYEAMQGNTTGTLNTAVGWQALLNNTTGSSNSAFGNQALKNATTTSHSTGIGDLALATLATGLDNTALGFGAGSSLIDGGMNTHIGSLAGNFQTHNNFNVAVGFKAAALDSAGNSDVEIGSYVASACLNVNYSVILGDSALGSSFPVGFSSHTRSQQFVNLIGAYIGVVSTPSNMAHYDSSSLVGYKIRMAESSTDTLGYNIDWFGGFNDTTSRHDFIGLGNEKNQLLNFSYGGGWNTAYLNAFPQRVGDMAWNTDTVGFVYSDGTNWHKFGTGGGGSGVTTVGTFSASSIANGASISGVTITFGPADGTNPGMIKASGAQTLGATLTVTNDMVIDGIAVGKGTHTVLQNTAVGNLALNAATGANNTAVGYVAGANITTGSSDTYLGSNAGKNTTTGSSNMALGASALNNNTSGGFDVAIGAGAMLTPSGVSNTVAIGYNALNALTNNGINNLAIGYTAMQSDTSGANNTVIGNGSLNNLLSGNANFVIGNQAGTTITTGSGNVLIGYKIDVASGSTSNTMDIAGLIFGQGLSTSGGSGVLSGSLGFGTTATNTSMVTVGIAAYNSAIGTGLVTATATSNDPVTSASGTVTDMAANVIGVPTFSATNTSVTYTNASSLYITGAPAAGTHVTITNPYSLKVAAGPTVLSGLLTVGTVSGSITWNPNGNYFFSVVGANLSDATTAASGTVSQVIDHNITGPTVSATNTGVTYTNAYTVFINGTPAAGTNVTITNPYALGVAGNALFQNSITAASVNLDGSADLTGQTAATTVTSYAVPGSSSSNTFRVGGYITVTAVSLDVIQLQVAWTDETSTSRTQSFFVQGATTGIGTTGANAYSPIDIRVKKGTTITVSTILTTGTGSITYDVGANITQLY